MGILEPSSVKDHARALLEARAITVQIGGHTVCRAMNLALYPGQCWAMLGINGVGKTTLLHTLAGLRPSQGGQILMSGIPLIQFSRRARAQRLGMVFQEASSSFPSTVWETMLVSRYPYLGGFGWETERDRAIVASALEAVDLRALAHRETLALSGGERQRLRIAAFLAQDTPLGLLDEPLNHLDPAYQMRLMARLVDHTRTQGGALLMVFHDINVAARFCDSCLLIYGDGQTSAGSTGTVLTATALARLYQHPMMPMNTHWGQGWLPA